MTANNLAHHKPRTSFWWLSIVLVEVLAISAAFIFFSRLDPDPQHDGAQIGAAIGVSQGLDVHREVFSQYGPIGPWINAIALEVFGMKLLSLRLLVAMQLILLNILIFLVCVTLRVDRRLALLTSFVWSISCPVWAYKKWFFQLWPWPSVTYMCLALSAVYVLLRFRGNSSTVSKYAHYCAGLLIGLAVFCRVNYGIPFLLAYVALEAVTNRQRSDGCNFLTCILGVVCSLTLVSLYLFLTDSFVEWFVQSVVGPAGDFLPQFLGWGYLYEHYVQDQLVVLGFLIIFFTGARSSIRLITITLFVCTALISALYFFSSLSTVYEVFWSGSNTEFLDRSHDQLSTTVLLRSTLLGSAIVLVRPLYRSFRTRSNSQNSLQAHLIGIAPLVACWVGALFQLYPFPDIYHLWWTSPPIFILCAIGLSRYLPGAAKLGLVAIFLIPTIMVSSKMRDEFSVQRTKWKGGVLDGMLIDNDFYPSFQRAASFLSAANVPAQFECREGLWPVFFGTYAADGPDYVNWAYGSELGEHERSGLTIRCIDRAEAENVDLSSFGRLSLSDSGNPLSFSWWSGWFNFYQFEREQEPE